VNSFWHMRVLAAFIVMSETVAKLQAVEKSLMNPGSREVG